MVLLTDVEVDVAMGEQDFDYIIQNLNEKYTSHKIVSHTTENSVFYGILRKNLDREGELSALEWKTNTQ